MYKSIECFIELPGSLFGWPFFVPFFAFSFFFFDAPSSHNPRENIFTKVHQPQVVEKSNNTPFLIEKRVSRANCRVAGRGGNCSGGVHPRLQNQCSHLISVQAIKRLTGAIQYGWQHTSLATFTLVLLLSEPFERSLTEIHKGKSYRVLKKSFITYSWR